ncbi:hypothetical protein CBW65_21810 [Tumebacillus avium]|uniref:DUF1468 domain-containing protein n=1 Tax=Tumebacillus avium TaxID=1903704 RepID=A0A1Y0ISA0_9BACL|nr:tripartite tricarboxylate transporter TctB family protein [Tumebacillus avium]ARU63327.1 hypothetical protein CBW65_21810 [Tumebacillus avium]
MRPTWSGFDRLFGVFVVLLGALAMWETVRLAPYGMSVFVGDHVLFGVVGGLMIVLGLVFLLFVKSRPPERSNRVPEARRMMGGTVLLLILYRLFTPLLGYVVCTLLLAFCLFKLIGAYSWVDRAGHTEVRCIKHEKKEKIVGKPIFLLSFS